VRLARVIFTESCEAPGALNRVAYLQSTEPARRDSYVEVLELTPLGVVALSEIYPMHMLRRVTLAAQVAPVQAAPLPSVEAPALAPRRPGRPRKVQ
jgi:hypothetical protein